jgi:hypothetical protein
VTDPWDFQLEQAKLSETWDLRFKIVGHIDVSEENRDEKFFIVMTTENLLHVKTAVSTVKTIPFPLAGVMIPIPAGEKVILVPNSPAGRISIDLIEAPRRNNQSRRGQENPFIVPAISKHTKVGELVLGNTTLKQALKILPAFPGYGPAPANKKPEPRHIGKTREVLERVDLGYNPMWSPQILLFDKNKMLVLVARSFVTEEEGTEARKIYDQHKDQLKEVYKQSGDTILQGEIQPCITLEVTIDESGNPNPIAYIYYCPTQ